MRDGTATIPRTERQSQTRKAAATDVSQSIAKLRAMLDLEATARQRFPDWFRGRREPAVRALVRGVARFARLDDAAALLDRHSHLRGLELVESLLSSLDTGYLVDPIERQRIP